MSDLLTTAAEALNTPESIVERSAAARAEANGTSFEDVLSAWAGGGSVAKASPKPDSQATSPDDGATVEPAPEPQAAAVATIEPPTPPVVTPYFAPEPEPEEPVEPVSMRRRVRAATRVGAWAGGGLGMIAFLAATGWWAANASVVGEETFTPVVVVDPTAVIIGTAVASILFGAIVAGLSRAAAGWINPGMRLSNSARSTALLGAFVGLVLGVVAGALLTGAFGTLLEGEEGLTQIQVLPALIVMLLGGAALGSVTAGITQAVGVPIATAEHDDEEIAEIRGRLRGAVAIPTVGILLLAGLVLPFAWALIESNRLTSGGAAVLAVITAAGILLFASMAGTKANTRLSLGEAIVAVIGIATVVVVVFAVLLAQNPPDEQHGEGEAAIVRMLT